MESPLARLDARMGGLESRMGGLENRVGGLENRVGGLENRVGGLETKVTEVQVDMRHMSKSLGRIETALLGDGSEDHPGLIKDVDRLKRSEKAKLWAFCIIGATLLSAATERVVAYFK